MIILIENTQTTVWLPIYTINGNFENFYQILSFLEIISYLFTACLVIKTCRIILKIKNFHENMNLLFIGLFLQWFEAFLSRLIVMPYQIGFLKIDNSKNVYISWWTSVESEMIRVPEFFQILPLFFPGLLIWHYVYSMFIGVTCVSIERAFATYYIRDYEKTPRIHIGMGLLCAVHCISFPFAYFMVNNRIPFILADSLCIVCVVIVCVLARNLICCATIFVAIACGLLMTLVLDLLPEWLKNPVAHCIENCIFLNPLLICTVAIFSVPSWKKEFIQGLPLMSKLRNEPNPNQNAFNPDAETREYFNQLRNAWL